MIDSNSTYLNAVEAHFQVARGTPTSTLSPADWALVESWQNAGIPLEAVLRGIDAAFDRRRKLPARSRIGKINSVAYCTNAIAEEAQAMMNAAPITRNTKATFPLEDVRAFVSKNAAALRGAGHCDLAESLESIDIAALYSELERLEQHLTTIEETMIARLRASANEESVLEARRALEKELNPYRGKMTPDQIARLEKQFLERRLLESAGLPRLSLFYL